MALLFSAAGCWRKGWWWGSELHVLAAGPPLPLRRSHATKQLVLKGRPYTPLWGDAALILNRRLSDQYAKTSPVFQMRQRSVLAEEEQEQEEQLEEGREQRRVAAGQGTPGGRPGGGRPPVSGGQEGRPGPAVASYQRREFQVGRYCCARLVLYHGLFHWKRRLLSRLKREVKGELRRRKVGAHVGGVDAGGLLQAPGVGGRAGGVMWCEFLRGVPFQLLGAIGGRRKGCPAHCPAPASALWCAPSDVQPAGVVKCHLGSECPERVCGEHCMVGWPVVWGRLGAWSTLLTEADRQAGRHFG